MRPLVNIDLAELPGEPEELYRATEIANLACGGHAGDPETLARALRLCRAHGVIIAAHPSYPDREGFGRRRLALTAEQVASSVEQQCAALAEVATLLKPHGALYHAADEDDALAAAIVAAARRALPRLEGVIGPAGGGLERAAASAGLRFVREGFADRAATEIAPGRWRLLPRDRPGAVISDPAQAVATAARVAPWVDTVCVHGDNPAAVAVATAVRDYLAATFSPTGQLTPVPPRPQ